jgi:hypothetical protein
MGSTPRSVSTEILWQQTSQDPGPAPSPDGPGREALIEVNDPELPYRVLLRLSAPAADGWQVTSLELIRLPSGPALGADMLSGIPLDGYVALAAGRLDASGGSSPDDAGCGPGSTATGPSPRAHTLRHGIDTETLATVARLYREALASPAARERLAPTAAVARAFGIDRNVAGRLVARARRGGMLYPAMRRQPGEVPPHPGPDTW